MIEDPDLTRQMRERAMVADCIDFLPINRMRERVFQDQSDSDVAFFYGLLFYGEFLIKLTGASHIAIIQDDTDRTRYGLLYDVVRANSVGDWVAVLDKIAAGPAANHVHPAASKIHQDLTKKHSGGWMVEALDCLHESMDALKIDYDKPSFISNYSRLVSSVLHAEEQDSWARSTKRCTVCFRLQAVKGLNRSCRQQPDGL